MITHNIQNKHIDCDFISQKWKTKQVDYFDLPSRVTAQDHRRVDSPRSKRNINNCMQQIDDTTAQQVQTWEGMRRVKHKGKEEMHGDIYGEGEKAKN